MPVTEGRGQEPLGKCRPTSATPIPAKTLKRKSDTWKGAGKE